MRPKIRCDGESTVLLQNFLDLNWDLGISAVQKIPQQNRIATAEPSVTGISSLNFSVKHPVMIDV
jgi:hypothetical protein